MEITQEDVLMHYGVKGMRWGRRKAGEGPNPVRVARAEANVARTQARVEAKKVKPVQSDAAIKTARGNLKSANDQVAVARAQYRVEKQTIGKQAAKSNLMKAKLDRDLVEIMNNDQASMRTSKEIVDDLIRSIFGV